MIEGIIHERQGRSVVTDAPVTSGVVTLIQAHLTTSAVVKAANYWPKTRELDAAFDAALDDVSAALDALARAPCENAEGFSTKMRYLIAHSHENKDDMDLEPLEAIRTAIEAWQEEQDLV